MSAGKIIGLIVLIPLLLILLAVGLFVMIKVGENSYERRQHDRQGGSVTPTSAVSPAAPVTENSPPVVEDPSRIDQGNAWKYGVNEDPMSGKQERFARVVSSNQLELEFPYSGKQRGMLMIRRHPKWGNDVIVSVEKGQVLCHGFGRCPISIRFDDASPVTVQGTPAADDSSEVFFLPYAKLVPKIAKAERLRLQFGMYQAGAQLLEFDVSGLDQTKISPKGAAN